MWVLGPSEAKLREEDGSEWLQDLSLKIFAMAYSFPGREVTLDCPAGTEVTSFRAFSGCDRDHIFGLKSLSSSWSVESATGQKPLFWAELLVLTFGLYYLDVVTDLQQLALFASEGSYEYLVLSCIGISIPIVTTLVEAVRWSFASSPQNDLFRHAIPSMAARVALICLSVVSQLHMLLLVICSVVMRTRHDLLLGAKHAEVAESGFSALLQSNFLLMILVGLESVSSEALHSLAISAAISVASLGFGFASRDKEDTKVLDVPGKLGWGPTLAGLILVRTLEVSSRLLAINVIHLSTRSGISLGGPAAVAMLAALSWLAFPEARRERAHLFAGIIAHPGQVLLGNRSQLPVRRSLCIQLFLQALALALQGLLHSSPTMLPEAQVLPMELLVVSLLATLASTLGLCALAHSGSKSPHPFFKSVAKGQPLTCTMLATAASKETSSSSVQLATLSSRS